MIIANRSTTSVKKYIIAALILVLSLYSSSCFAGEFDIDLLGLSYHFDKEGADRDAPLKLDRAGMWVVNPGIGLGYDFRNDIRSEGFSPIIGGGYFHNCSGSPFAFAGPGLRYRKFILKNVFGEVNVEGMLTYGNDSEDKTYRFGLVPYANAGLGYDFGKYLLTFSVSYIPQYSGASITDGTDILFMNVAVSF